MANSGPIIAEQSNVRYGSNGYYDIRLRRQGDQAMLIEVALSLFFDFIPNGADPNVTWLQQERDSFTQEWLKQIPATWDQRDHTSHGGYGISLAFICDVREAAGETQWQAHVMKLKSRNAFRTSAVCRGCYARNYDAKLDSNDDLLKPGGRRQTAMIHEFGHMLGLSDEYASGSSHYADKNSVMNLGTELRERHLKHFVDWAKTHIDDAANGSEPRSEKQRGMRTLRHIAEARTADEEIEAVRAWRDGGGPEEGVHFVVRRRGTQEDIPMEEISFDDYENLEVEFSSAEEGEVFVWEPKARDSLEMFFVE
jgi:hypothetical protein